MADPNVRPDAMPEDPGARPTNAFKAALNIFMYGSRDPSYVDQGEFRARGAFQHYAGEGMALSASARPEVAGAIYQSYANQGAMAAQSMRERYYQKEHRQMVQAQIIPLKAEFDAVDEQYRNATQIVYMPTARTVTPEEAHARGVAMQASTPAPPEVVKTGKTAEGKDKTKVVDGVAPPQPNAAIGQQTMGAVEYTPESLAYIDPVTGSPVQITSLRGRAIEREASDKLMQAHNSLMIGMMDVFAQYPGNPFAVQSMQKIMDGMVNAAGKAVTGRADSYEQLKYYQEWKEKEANIQKAYADAELTRTQEVGARTQANTLLRNLDKSVAGDLAATADAVKMAKKDPEFLSTLGPTAQENIRQGVPVEQWDEKTALETAQRVDRTRELQLKSLEVARKAGMVHIEPQQNTIGHIQNWPSTLAQDPEYKRLLPIRYAQMEAAFATELGQISSMSTGDKEAAMDNLGVPQGDTELRNLIAVGATGEDKVKAFMLNKIMGTEDYADAQTMTYMDTLAVALRDQPEVGKTILEDNEGYIQDFIQQQRRLGASEEEIQADVEYMQTDPMGTHVMSITGKEAPDYRPYGYGTATTPASRASAGGASLPDLGQTDPTQPVQNVPSAEAAPVSVTLDRAMRGNAAGMTNDELGAAIDLLSEQQQMLMRAGGEKARKAMTRVNDRLRELRDEHITPVGQAVYNFLERREERHQAQEKQVDDLLTAIEPEPVQSSSTPKAQPNPALGSTYTGTPFGQPERPVSMTPEQAMTFDASTMTQTQLQKSIELIKGKQSEMMAAGDYSPKSVEVLQQLSTRLGELNKYHMSWIENLFRTDKVPRVN